MMRILAAALLLAAALPGAGRAGEARDLMTRVIEEADAGDEIVEMRVTLVDSSGTRWERDATFLQKRTAEGLARLIRFHTPAELAGSAVLAVARPEGDSWWVYLPTFHTTRRIAPGNRSETYIGTDFSYGDLTSLRPDEYEFSFLGWEVVDGSRCRILEVRPCTPSVAAGEIYSRRVYWVDPDRAAYAKAVFYGADGSTAKEIRNSGSTRPAGHPRWSRSEIRTRRTGHRTILEVRERRDGSTAPDRLFTERGLRRAG